MRGFTLLEVLFAMTILAVVAFGLVSGVGAGHATAKRLEEETVLFSRGQELVEGMLAVEFGQSSDSAATAPELTECFDGDDDLGAMTLHKLRKFGPAQFEPAAFPVRGRFTVIVSDDLNGDGDTDDPDEGQENLLRIEVSDEGRLLARTIRLNPTG